MPSFLPRLLVLSVFLATSAVAPSLCLAQAMPVAPVSSDPAQPVGADVQPTGPAAATPLAPTPVQPSDTKAATAASAGAQPSAPVGGNAVPPVSNASSGSSSSSAPSAPSTPVSDGSSSSLGSAGGLGAANGDYVLRPGDSIDMVIFHEPDLSIRSRIGKDGLVQLPLLGEIKLAGLTIRSATTLVHDRYNADYLVDPQIYLNIAAYSSRKFTIIGQVTRPGTYEFGGAEDIGLLEAIGMAGGFTRIADRGRVIVKRKEGDSVRTLKVNAKKMTNSGVDKFFIQPGDVINVGESWY